MSLLVYTDSPTYIRLHDNQISFYRILQQEGEGYEPYTTDELNQLNFVTPEVVEADYSTMTLPEAHEFVKEKIQEITGSNTVEILL